MKEQKKRGCFGRIIFSLFIIAVIIGAAFYRTNPQIINALIERHKSNIGQGKEKEAVSIPAEELQGRYYFHQLSKEKKTLYEQILQGVQNFNTEIAIQSDDSDAVGEIYQKVLYDSPELFWCDGSFTTTTFLGNIVFTPKYRCTPEEKEARKKQIDAAVNDCIKGTPTEKNTYEKIKYVYEYLVDQTNYKTGVADSQNIYSVFVNQASVCAGYAKATQYLLQKLGIECIYVVGTTVDSGQSHAWNMVNIDGEYYHLDTTWGDPVFVMQEDDVQNVSNISYDYLCCSDKEVSRTHKWDKKLGLPACTSTKYNYYILNDCYYDSYDSDQILKAMNDTIYAKGPYTIFKFADDAIYKKAKNPILKDLASRAMQNLMSAYGLESVSCSQMVDDSSNKIIIYWKYDS